MAQYRGIVARTAARSKLAVIVVLLGTLGGCGLAERQLSADRSILRGVRATVEEIDHSQIAEAQNRLITALLEQSHLKNAQLQADDARWDLVMRAGLHLVNGHCDQYLNALFVFNREQRAGRQVLSGINAATAAALGLTGVAGTTISLITTAFGLAETTFDATTNSILFQIEPSALRNIAIQGRAEFLQDLGRQRAQSTGGVLRTRPDVMIALQGYLTQCSPAALEANINNAASGSPMAVTRRSSENLLPGTRSGAPTVTLTGRPFALSIGEVRPAPQQPRPVDRAPNLLEGETSLSLLDIAAIQRALGVAADGNPGPIGSATRQAIAEAQRALAAATGEPVWSSEAEGRLSGLRIRAELLGAGPMPSTFVTPFERFYLATSASGFREVDEGRMRTLRQISLGLSAGARDTWWIGLREALAAKRRDNGLSVAGEANPGRLDSALYARLQR